MKKDKQQNNNIIFIGVIVVLISIIAFLILKKPNKDLVENESIVTNKFENIIDAEDKGVTNIIGNMKLNIEVIGDKRCKSCITDKILEEIQKLPSMNSVSIIKKDFSDEGVEAYLKENGVTQLPLIVFSTNEFDTSKDPVKLDNKGNKIDTINKFLQELKDGKYYLPVGAEFDPFKKRSDRGFLLLEKSDLDGIKEKSHIKGNKTAKITWIEYSDLECPYCAKLHNSGTPDELMKKYGDDLNIAFNHFPLGFHQNAQIGAEVLECLAEEKGTESFYSLIKKSFKEENSNKSFLIDEAIALGGSKSFINKCLDENRYTDKVKKQMEKGSSLFGITGTPGNVLINNETGEYEIISGAYPVSSFENIIDRLLK